MRPILLSALLFITSTTFAQKWEIGLDGGIALNSIPSFQQKSDYIKPSKLSLTGDVKLFRDFKKWQVGLSISAVQLTYINKMQFWLEDMSNPFTTEPVGEKVTLANPEVPVLLFLNRKININHVELYGGLSAGYVYASQTYKYFYGVGIKTFHNEGNGYAVGGQLGANYYITRHIGINGELHGTYNYLQWHEWPAEAYRQAYSVNAFSATLGIRYKF